MVEAAAVANVLLQAMKNNKDNTYALPMLAQGLSAVASRMEAKDASAVAAPAVIVLLQALNDAKSANALPGLAEALSALAVRLVPEDATAVAVPAAIALIQAQVHAEKQAFELRQRALHTVGKHTRDFLAGQHG